MLCHAVTLTFDLLILNFYSTSGVMFKPGHRAIMTTQEVCFRVRIYLATFSSAGGSRLSDVENDAKFRTFWPTPVKIRGGEARSLYQLLQLYLRPNVRNTFDGHPLRGAWVWCIDKKEKASSLRFSDILCRVTKRVVQGGVGQWLRTDGRT